MGRQAIFSKEFLAEYLDSFNLSSVVGLRKKQEIIQNWMDSFASNKISWFKEEEVKSRFIMEIFGEVLGFNYKNPGVWLCREEVKTDVDATKPDAALGLFKTGSSGIINEVHAVIEIKDSKANLDKSQNRKAFKLSPVEQAFFYAPKMGGHCKWVIVSNFAEIRFYHHTDQSRYQSYKLHDLGEEYLLKELLFLFQKDHLTHSQISVTDKLYELKDRLLTRNNKTAHIVDQMYDALHKFEGLEFIDPAYVANLKPFNVLDDYVWHFSQNTLYTINPEIYGLLSEVAFSEGAITLSKKLEKTLKSQGVADYLKKLKYVFQRLYQCLIKEICAVEHADPKQAEKNRHITYLSKLPQLKFTLYSQEPMVCDCINCNYRSLDFKKLIAKVKAAKANDSLSRKTLAYGHYLLASDNFRETYYIYKSAELETKGVEHKNIEYLLTKINLSHLYNLVSGYGEQSKKILDDIKAIDLDRSIHNELDIYVDGDVRRYLIKIKEFELFNKIEKKIAELVDTIKHIKEMLNKGDYRSGPNDLMALNHQYHLLYSHFHKNYLVYDAFTDFKTAVTKVFQGLIYSFQTMDYGLTKFSEFYLTEAVLYIPRKELIPMLEDCPVLPVSDNEREVFVVKAISFLASFCDTTTFGAVPNADMESQLANWQFRYRYENSFSNLFTLLARLELNAEQATRFAGPVMNFVRLENFLAGYELHELGKFLEIQGAVFKRYELVELLSFIIGKTKYGYNKYDSLIGSLCVVYPKVSPQQTLSEQSIIRRAVENHKDDHGRLDMVDLLCLYNILDSTGQAYFKQELVGHLQFRFEPHLYDELLRENILKWEEFGFFDQFVASVNRTKYDSDPVFLENGNQTLHNTTMVNFIATYYRVVGRYDPVLKGLTELSPFAQWAFYPDKFDYAEFDVRWLKAAGSYALLVRMSKVRKVRAALEQYLSGKEDEDLAKIYFRLMKQVKEKNI